MKWIDVNNRLPKEGNYLCFMDNGYIKMCYYDNIYWTDMWETNLYGTVKFWMPLPQSPYAVKS